MKKLVLVLSCVLVLMMSGVVSGTNLLLNGSFENAGTQMTGQGIGSGALSPGWQITSGNIDLLMNSSYAADGSLFLDMNGGTAGAIAQSFATTPGTSYHVTFEMSGNPDTGRDYPPFVKEMRVSAAGQSSDYAFDTTNNLGWIDGWATETFDFVATNNTTTLSFESLMGGDSAAGPALDDVTVVPEPTTLALLSLGGLLLRRRKS